MLRINQNYAGLEESYLFSNIAQKIKAYQAGNPEKHIYRMGIGDVTLPLCDAVVRALHEAVDDQASRERFHGYMPESGDPALRAVIATHYEERGVHVHADEVFITSGASDMLGDILDLFDDHSISLIIEPAYPAYVDANIMAGNSVVRLSAGEENGFLPEPDETQEADIIYICTPANPTGAVYTKDMLKKWVDYANRMGAVILFDAAYEAFIEDGNVPHSIFEISGAETCSIEICSFSKMAGFTGMRLGYTVISEKLIRCGRSIRDMWIRNQATKTNGVSYVMQKGGAAVFTPAGQMQIRENIETYKENGRIITKAMEELNIPYWGGKNAPYVWFKCPMGMSGWEFFDYLLQNIQVVGTPGEGFGLCGKGYFRFSSFAGREDTINAMERFRELLG